MDSIIRLEKMGYTFTVKNGDIETGFTSGSIAFNELYGKQLTQNSYVFIQRFDDETWQGYRITYDDFNNISSEKTILEGTDFVAISKRAETYVNNYMKFVDVIRA